tara:strand:+ start:22 stop:771 length:750 start_codon:yes stop_codon:yes gene_type:complete
MSEKPNPMFNDQQAIDDILKEMPANEAIELDLPSKNRFYNLKEPGKPITLRPMTFADEKSMLSKNTGNLDIINKLLARCLENVDVGQLLQIDKLYILMKLREISYGPEYTVSINCSKCKSENKVNFQLDTFNVRYADDNLTDPRTVHLPVLKKDVVVRLPRVTDEKYFANTEQSLVNLWRFVEKIDKYDSKPVISKVIPQLPIKDAHTLLEAIGCNDYGIDTNVRFDCAYCDNIESMELPITADFFSSK